VIDLPNHKKLMDIMRDDRDSMARNKVWKLIDLSP